MNKKEISINVIYTIVANLLKLFTSFILTIVVPRYMGVAQYGYWQLFLLYTTYMGYSYLGIADGMYLKEGGKEYKELDYEDYSNQMFVVIVYEIILALTISLLSIILVKDSLKTYLIIWAAIDMVIYIPRQTMKYILQATNRIKEYSISISIFTISNCLLICGMLLLNICDVKYIVVAHAFTEFLSFIYTFRKCKDIWSIKKLNIKAGLISCVDNAKIGINILIASASSTLAIGIIRNAVENKWGIEQFGALSLALSISKLFLIFINSISVVLFPILRRLDNQRLSNLYSQMRGVLIIPFWIIMIFYIPIKYIIGIILPQYIEALNYVTYLIPMCLYECIMALLVNTYLKTIRKEKILLFTNVITVLASIIASYISVKIIGSIIASLISIVVIIMLRTIIGEYFACKYLNIKNIFGVIMDIFMSIGFILIYHYFSGMISIIMYLIILLIYCYINKSIIKQIILLLKGLRKNA